MTKKTSYITLIKADELTGFVNKLLGNVEKLKKTNFFNRWWRFNKVNIDS